MVNLPRGQEIQGLHGVPSLVQGTILRFMRLNGLSVITMTGDGKTMLTGPKVCAAYLGE